MGGRGRGEGRGRMEEYLSIETSPLISPYPVSSNLQVDLNFANFAKQLAITKLIVVKM